VAGLRLEDRDLGGTRRVAHLDAHEEAVELRLGQGIGALELDRVLRGDDHERRAQRIRAPSTVTWRSSIASSSADWVFGEARLISSARTTLANTPPGGTSNWSRARFHTDTPVTSDGRRSG
jgi:hypothetical protein